MFGFFPYPENVTNPKKIAAELHSQIIVPTLAMIKILYKERTGEKKLPEVIYKTPYFIAFFYGLCLNLLGAYKKEKPNEVDFQISDLIVSDYILPDKYRTHLEKNISNFSSEVSWDVGLENARRIVMFSFSLIDPRDHQVLMHSAEVAKEFIEDDVDPKDLLSDEKHKEFMTNQLWNQYFIDELETESLLEKAEGSI